MSNKRWDDDEFDPSGGGNEENEFWMEFVEFDPASMGGIPIQNILVNRETEFALANKQLNIEILEKAIRVARSSWKWWFLTSERRAKLIRNAYRTLSRLIHEG